MPIVKPNEGIQMQAVRSNADFVLLTGAGGGGKSAAAVLRSNKCLTVPDYSSIVFLKNIDDFEKEGSLAKEFFKFYPLRRDGDRIPVSKSVGKYLKADQKILFDNNSSISFMHLADERTETIVQRTKSIQTDNLTFDECQNYRFSTIDAFETRMRSLKNTRKQIVMCQNATKDGFMFNFVNDDLAGGGWVSAETGYVHKDRNGKLRYVSYVNGDLSTCIWGDTKEEVYRKAKARIDALCARNPQVNWRSTIRSVAFFSFSAADNKMLNENNPDYASRVATSALSGNMGEPCWLYSSKDDEEERASDIHESVVTQMFYNTPNKNWKRRIIADFAEEGKDNLTVAYAEGFHIIDIEYSMSNSYQEGVDFIKRFMHKWGLDDRSLIVDVQGNVALKSAFPNATKWSGAAAPTPRGKGSYNRLKHEAADMLMLMINNGLYTIDNSLMDKDYKIQRGKRDRVKIVHRSILTQFILESKGIIFKEDKYGKRILLSKEEAKKVFFNGESPNLFDLCIMHVGGLIYDCYRVINEKKSNGSLIYSNPTYDLSDKVNIPIMMNKRSIANVTKQISRSFGW